MSKKIIAILFAALMVFGAGLTAFADNPPVISVGEAKAIKGSTIEVPVSLENNTGFSAISVELNFNRDVLTLINVKAPEGVKISMKSQYYYNEPYVIKWIFSPEVCELNGEMAILVFKVSDDAEVGDYPISIDYFKGPTGNWVDGVDTNVLQDGGVTTPLGLQYEYGSVTVIGPKTVSVNAGGKSAEGEIEVLNGMVIVSLYNDEHKQIDIKIFDAADDAFVYVSNKTAKYAGIMCWEKTDTELKPVMDKLELTLN